MGGNICLYLCSVCCLIACWIGQLNGQSVCQQLEPSPVLQKFVDPLPIPANIDLSKSSSLTMGAYKITQNLHRDLPNTTVYAFGTSAACATYPGPTLTARRGVAARIRWQNGISDSEHLLVVDKTLNWANPANGGVPMVVHLHGGEVPSTSDGHPNAWYTAKGDKGPTWSSQNYYYPNTQFPAMLWYHDHTIGITRLNVYAGLVGLYFITSNDEANDNLPTGNFHVPLVIQDKQFYANGSLSFPNVGSTPNSHPNWCPEFFGDTILVNGKAWPYFTLQARRYRFRMLNGANARFFTLSFNSSALFFTKIGTDGGFLSTPLNQTTLTFSPGERVDVIVDFSSIAPGSDIILQNSAPAPFPGGSPPSSDTAVVMKFHVVAASNRSRTPFSVPKIFGPDQYPANASNAVMTRNHTLVEILDSNGNVVRDLINNLTMSDPVTEKPKRGTTEIWQIINLTQDAHPIHLHLVRFRMLNRQAFDAAKYQSNSCSIATDYPDSSSCYTKASEQPDNDHVGWKDTVVSWPGYVTRFIITFTAQDESAFSFNITAAPGYVWHCHILDHEDNEMMRPLQIQP